MFSNIPAPDPAWMHKPRSQKSGLFSALRTAGDWNKRYVCVDTRGRLTYGPEPTKLDKAIPFETISAVKALPAPRMVTDGCPAKLVSCGWELTTGAKTMVMACEAEAVRDDWVRYLEAVIDALAGAGTAAPPSTHDEQDLETATQRSFASQRGGTVQSTVQSMARDHDLETNFGGDDAELDADQMRTQQELRRLVGGDDEDDYYHDDMALDDDDLSDVDSDDSEAQARLMHMRNAQAAAQFETAESKYRRFLLPIAERKHEHIRYKTDDYAALLEDRDTADDIVFSRSLFKIGKKDQNQERDLMLTHRRLYLVAPGRWKRSVRAIPIDQVVGVLESTVESDLVAILIPSFHDILLRVTKQQSAVGGTETDVKHHLIAHLFAVASAADPDRQFIFREATNVRSLIRRSEEDSHLPLEGHALDKLHVAGNPNLYPTFRINAESKVLFSCHCDRINAAHKHSGRIFAVTDRALYLCSVSGDKVSKRMPLAELSQIKKDVNTNQTRLEFLDVDVLLVIKADQDFETLLRIVPLTAAHCGRPGVQVISGRGLVTDARLWEAKNIKDKVGAVGGATEAGVKRSLKVSQMIIRRTAQFSASSVGKLGTGLADLGRDGFDALRSGVANVGEVLVDNALTGELLGAAGALFQHGNMLADRVVTLKDEARLLKLPEPRSDALGLQGTLEMHKITEVLFSARCKRFNLTAHMDTQRTTSTIAAVTDRGVYIFDDPTAADASLFTAAVSFLRSERRLTVEDRIKWADFRGLVRCHAEPSVVGLLAKESGGSDVMVRLPSAAAAEKLVAHAAVQFARVTSKPHCRVVPGVFSSDTTEQLKAALRRSTFDPEATIALRRHPHSDALAIGRVTDIVDLLRRHGDNTVAFSGVGWGFRGSQLSKPVADLTKQLAKPVSSDQNKALKAVLVVLTNTAVYLCHPESHDIRRRLDLRDIAGIQTAATDPHGLLLKCSGAHDLYIRLEGRAREFADRLQEASLEWTEFSLYLPHEAAGSHDIAAFALPQSVKQETLGGARLPPAPEWEEREAQLSAQDIHRRAVAGLVEVMTRALASEGGPPDEHLGDLEDFDAEDDAEKPRTTWAAEAAREGRRVARVRHAVERAYVYGLRPAQVPVMVECMRQLQVDRQRRATARALCSALADDDLDAYETAQERADEVGGLGDLLFEQAKASLLLRRRRRVVDKIHAAMEAGMECEVGVDAALEDKLPEIDALFGDAEAAGVRQERLAHLRQQLSAALQKQRLAYHLRANVRNPHKYPPAARGVLLDTAEELGVPLQFRGSIIDAQDPLVKWASRLLTTAVESGEPKQMRDAIAVVEARGEAEVVDTVGSVLEDTKAELKAREALSKQVASLHELCAQLRETIDTATPESLFEAEEALDRHVAALAGGRALKPAQHLGLLYLQRVRERLSTAAEMARAQEIEAEAVEQYKHRMLETELAQQRAAEEAKRAEAAERAAKRMGLAVSWDDDAQQVHFSMKQAVSAVDSGRVASGVRRARSLLEAVQEQAKEFPSEERPQLQPIVDDAVGKLRAAAQLGEQFADRQRQQQQQSQTLPEPLLEAITALDGPKVATWIKANEGTPALTAATVDDIAQEWARAVARKAWLDELHTAIHRAVALKDTAALEEQLEVARAKNHADSVVTDARKWLEAHLAEKAAAAAAAEKSAEEAAHAATPHKAAGDGVDPSSVRTPPPTAKPQQPRAALYDLQYSWPSHDSKSQAVLGLHAALRSILTVEGIAEGPKAKLVLPAGLQRDVKVVCDAWAAVLGHRIKPQGFFKKTERTLPDVVTFVGKLTRRGDVVAPFCMHLMGEFDRVKKFNNPQGLSAAVILVQFLMGKGELERLLEDVFRLLPKEAEDIFLEDSLFRGPNEAQQKDLRLMAKMTAQVLWDFDLADRASAIVGGSLAARQSDPSLSPNQSIKGRDDAEVRMAASPAHLAQEHVALLKTTVQRLAVLFTQHRREAKADHDPAALKLLFDENKHKGVGLLAREGLCVALTGLLSIGFRPTAVLFKRHLWDMVEAAADRLRQSARGIGGVAIPDAVDMVRSLSTADGHSNRHSALASMSETQLKDVRLRMFLCHAMNQQALAAFLQAILGLDHAFLAKFYFVDRAALLMREVREPVEGLLALVSRLPFVLSIDAEIW